MSYIGPESNDLRSILQYLTALIGENPYYFTIAAFVGICTVTRVLTGLRCSLSPSSSNQDAARSPPVLPYWVPVFGHAFSYLFQYQAWLKHNSKAYATGVYQIRLGVSTRIVITTASLQAQVLAPDAPVSQDKLVSSEYRDIFGDGGTTKNLIAKRVFWEGPHKVLDKMLSPEHVRFVVDKSVEELEGGMYDLISGNTSWVDQHAWERAARVNVMHGEMVKGQQVVIASLQALIRHWVGMLSLKMLMGKALVENNQNFLDDFWIFEEKVSLFKFGLPYWIVPTLGPAAWRREKMIQAITEHHDAMIKVLNGQDPETKYDDLDDVSTIIKDRVKQYNRLGIRSRGIAASNLGIIWAVVANTAQVSFWLAYHILATPGLLQDVREEIAPHVTITKPPDTGLPFKDPPALKVDQNGLKHKCPVLESTLRETLRYDTSPMAYAAVEKDFTIKESLEDAKLVGKATSESYMLKKGQILCLPGQLHGHDPRYLDEPQNFNPRRFLSTSKGNDGEVENDMGSEQIWPWGGWQTTCKGRNVAQQQISLFIAALLSCYEFEPVDAGQWKRLAKRERTGTAVASRDIRVRMWKRTDS